MDHVSHILTKVLAKRGLREHSQAASVTHRTREWLSTQMSSDVVLQLHVTSYADGVVIIGADHPIAAQEVHMRHNDLLTYLRESGVTDVVEIRVVRSKNTTKPQN